MSAHVDFLATKVAKLKTVGASFRALTADLAVRLRAAAGDREATLAIANELDTEAEADAAAIVENTVAADEPPAEPTARR